MQQFSCKTKIISGPGSIRVLKEMNIQSLLLVTDPYFRKNGTADRLLTLSGAVKTGVFDKIQPDPSVELAAEGTALARDLQPDTIVALGGGSTMDCAKAIAHFAGGSIRLVAIPTTSGSGSEVTDFAVLTHENTKYPLVDPAIRPAAAILDSDLLKELPKSLIADTGFDVLGHAVESYTGKNATAITDALAQAAFCTVLYKLPGSFSGDTSLRGEIHAASTMAGLSFTHGGLGLCHALAHALGAACHVPHGRLIAILLPPVIDCNAHACSAKYAQLARAAGLPGSVDTLAVRSLKNALVRLRRELSMPQNLQEAGMDVQFIWQHMDAIVSAALADPCIQTNPLPVEDFMVRRVLEAVMGRG